MTSYNQLMSILRSQSVSGKGVQASHLSLKSSRVVHNEPILLPTLIVALVPAQTDSAEALCLRVFRARDNKSL